MNYNFLQMQLMNNLFNLKLTKEICEKDST